MRDFLPLGGIIIFLLAMVALGPVGAWITFGLIAIVAVLLIQHAILTNRARRAKEREFAARRADDEEYRKIQRHVRERGGWNSYDNRDPGRNHFFQAKKR